MHLTGQLPPALSWAVPNQKGAAPPRSVSLIGCVGFRVKTDKRIDNCAPGNRKMKTTTLKLDTWNVRTMTSGLSDDLQEVNAARKTAVIDREQSRLQMGIVALQETRVPETGSVRERDFTLFWRGKPSDEVREHGEGFTVRNRLLGSIAPPAEGTDRILSLRLPGAILLPFQQWGDHPQPGGSPGGG